MAKEYPHLLARESNHVLSGSRDGDIVRIREDSPGKEIPIEISLNQAKMLADWLPKVLGP